MSQILLNNRFDVNIQEEEWEASRAMLWTGRCDLRLLQEQGAVIESIKMNMCVDDTKKPGGYRLEYASSGGVQRRSGKLLTHSQPTVVSYVTMKSLGMVDN